MTRKKRAALRLKGKRKERSDRQGNDERAKIDGKQEIRMEGNRNFDEKYLESKKERHEIGKN